jgi:hypothetical protein
MKIKIMVIDFERPPRAKRWTVRIGIPVLLLVGAVSRRASGSRLKPRPPGAAALQRSSLILITRTGRAVGIRTGFGTAGLATRNGYLHR